jgi:hypothetical protein
LSFLAKLSSPVPPVAVSAIDVANTPSPPETYVRNGFCQERAEAYGFAAFHTAKA